MTTRRDLFSGTAVLLGTSVLAGNASIAADDTSIVSPGIDDGVVDGAENIDHAAFAERLEPIWDRVLDTPELRALFDDIRAIDETGS